MQRQFRLRRSDSFFAERAFFYFRLFSMNTFRHFLAIGLFFGAILPCFAQRDFSSRFEFGANFIDHSAVNAALVAKKMPQLNTAVGALGMGLNGFLGNWVVGGKMYGYMAQQPTDANYQVTLSRYLFATVQGGGVVWRNKRNMMLYPLVGVGYGANWLRLQRVSYTIPDRYRANGVLGDVSLNFSQFKPILGDEEGYRTEMGITVGYHAQLGNGWNLKRLADATPDLADAPINAAPAGWYIRLALGIVSKE